MKKILILNTPNSVHILKDADMFKSLGFHSKVFTTYTVSGISGLFSQLFLAFKLCYFYIFYSYVYIRFADYHSFLPILLSKVFRVKSILVIGGYDADCIPSLNYGVCTNPIRQFVSEWSAKNATFLVPVHESIGNILLKRIGKIKGKYFPIANGFDEKIWYCDTKKENQIITVGAFNNLKTVKIKGLDFFVSIAESLPEFTFKIIGCDDKSAEILGMIPPNLKLIEKLPHTEVRKHLSASKVCVQFSLSEGMPNALCEAMLCECIPLGTNVGGIKDIIGPTGYVIENQNIELAKHYILQALNDDKDRYLTRDRIISCFPIHLRQEKFYDLLLSQDSL